MDISPTYCVIDVINMSADYLKQKKLENARLNAELLLCHILKMSRVQLYLNYERPLSANELQQIRVLLKRRSQHEPIQYILEETEFYSLKINVNKNTFIPRPETELLVETIINYCKPFESQRGTIDILDIGTGSGNIAIALAKNLEHVFITAIEIQSAALAIAARNAEYHQVNSKIEFIEHDIFLDPFPVPKKYDVIVSNPPYISKQEMERLPDEIQNYEPHIALFGGIDGLCFYYKIAERSTELLATNGRVIVEIGANQAEAVKYIFSKNPLFHEIEILNDLNLLPRAIRAKN